MPKGDRCFEEICMLLKGKDWRRVQFWGNVHARHGNTVTFEQRLSGKGSRNHKYIRWNVCQTGSTVCAKALGSCLFKMFSVWSDVSKRESEERWHQRMLKNKVASLLLPKLQVTGVSHPHNEIVAKMSCMCKWISSVDWALASVY